MARISTRKIVFKIKFKSKGTSSGNKKFYSTEDLCDAMIESWTLNGKLKRFFNKNQMFCIEIGSRAIAPEENCNRGEWGLEKGCHGWKVLKKLNRGQARIQRFKEVSQTD